MESTTFFCSVGLVFLSTLLLLLRRRRRRPKRLNTPPTIPFSVPILGHLHLLVRHRQPIHRTLAAISAAHGPLLLLRFGSRPVLLVSSPSAAEDCLTTNDLTFANRPSILATKHLGFDHSILAAAPYGPHWRTLRRLATTELFTTSRIKSFAHARTDEVSSLIRSLFRCGRREWHRVEMKPTLMQLVLNILTRAIDGRKYCGEEGAVETEEGRRFRRVVGEAFSMSGASNVEDFVPLVNWLGARGTVKRMVRLAREIEVMFQEMIDERRRRLTEMTAEEKEKKTIIGVMLSMQEAEPGTYSDKIIIGMIWVLIAAGSESSSGTLEWAISLLLNHPQVLKKARDEIELQVGHDRLISDSDIPHLPYLQNVIKETLRLFPSAPLLLPHQSSRDCNVQGYHILKDTMLLINVYAIQRDPILWEEAERFKPERFEEGKEEGNQFQYLPFGSGRRRCPGDTMVFRVVGLALGGLIQCFEWRSEEEMVDLTEGDGLNLPKKIPLVALCKPRQDMINVLSQL